MTTTAKGSRAVAADEPVSESGVQVRGASAASAVDDDPIRDALRRAPRLALTAAERQELEEIERSTSRWIPHDEAVALLRHGDDQ